MIAIALLLLASPRSPSSLQVQEETGLRLTAGPVITVFDAMRFKDNRTWDPTTKEAQESDGPEWHYCLVEVLMVAEQDAMPVAADGPILISP